MDASGQTKSIRVVVRVRPLLASDGASGTHLLQLDPTRPNEVVLASSNERRAARRYTFDHVFGPQVSQDELYGKAGVSELVAAAVGGYHATIFAYGQTGSGKTFTMEGYRYVTHGSSAGKATAQAPQAAPPTPATPAAVTSPQTATPPALAAPPQTPPPAAAAAAGSPGGRNGAVRAAAAGAGSALGSGAAGASAAPHADFSSTPEQQLGLIPRVLRELFAQAECSRDRRFTIRCSFVQIYREQVYDLLNPATLAALPAGSGGGGAQRRAAAAAALGGMASGGGGGGGGGVAVSGPLRLRWSPQEEFYLENLFTPEVESAEEALRAFQAGVANKVMSSHRLNAASSRSHCLFTLHVTSSPHASPLEQRTAKMTLVDLAGSERAATTGATEGALRDESVAINKSLFTLRQVITALTEASSSSSTTRPATSTSASAAAAPPHVPYRDSKLTCLLKHSLGGSSLTLMLACLAPADRWLEENASTLDYAARARRITNQVAVNEDPRSRLIRELRAEVAFLRQQLQAAGGATPHTLPPLPQHLLSMQLLPGTQSAAPAGRQAAAAAASAAASGGGGAVGAAGAPAAADSDGDGEAAARLRAAGVEALVGWAVEASRVAAATSATLAELRDAYARSAAALDAVRAEYDSLAAEDAKLRDRAAMLEALVGGGGQGGGLRPMGQSDGGAGAVEGGMYTASTASLIELEELRRENALLHERLQLLDPMDPDPGGRPHAGTTMRNNPTRHSTASAGNGGGTGGVRSSTSASVRSSMSRQGAVGNRPGAGPGGSGGSSALQRAHSAGALRASGGRAAAAAAAAAANPFIPRDVLLAMSPPGAVVTAASPAAAAEANMGGGGGRPAALAPANGPSAGSMRRPPSGNSQGVGSGTGGGGGGGVGRTLTVDQLRSMLHMGGGGGNETLPSRPSTSLNSADGTADGAAGGSSSASSTTSGRLAELGHVVASRALASGVRLSTTGKLLPTTPARVAVEAATVAAGGGGALSGQGGMPRGATLRPASGGLKSSSGGGEERDLQTTPSAEVAEGPVAAAGPMPAEAAALAQLLAERNALRRQRLVGGT